MQKVIQYKFWEKLSQNGKLRATKFSFKEVAGMRGCCREEAATLVAV
jgi:hypothetical protein